MNPLFRLRSGERDITQAIEPRLLALRVLDHDGLLGDELTLELDDRQPQLALPRPELLLSLELGYRQTGLVLMGRFQLTKSLRSQPPARLTIYAQGAVGPALSGEYLEEERQRSYQPGITLADLVASIAASHGLKAVSAPQLSSIVLPHLDQNAESDLHFLTRLARRYGVLVKPGGGKLVAVPHGHNASPKGVRLPVVELNQDQLISWELQEQARRQFHSVEARFRGSDHDRSLAVRVGQGLPICRLRTRFENRYQALQAASNRLAELERARTLLRLTLPGRAELTSQSRLSLTGLTNSVAGLWVVTRVIHRLNHKGYHCSLEARRP